MRVLITPILLAASASAFLAGPARAPAFGLVSKNISPLEGSLLRMSSVDESTTAKHKKQSTADSATAFVKELLHALSTSTAGYSMLLEDSTPSWRHAIYQAVGAPDNASSKAVCHALQHEMTNPKDQFAILVGHGPDFVATFPSDAVSYEEGSCWVECRLRGTYDDELLVATGWQLVQKDGQWLVDSIDWQDFREEFYPGIGREEWARLF